MQYGYGVPGTAYDEWSNVEELIASHWVQSPLGCTLVHVITRKRLNEFAEKHPDAKSALVRWYALMRTTRFSSFVHLRELFPQADQVGRFTVFNIGGNKVRLIAAVHYNRNKIYIRHVLTHQEYDTGKWKE